MATVNELVTALGFELKPDALKNINKIEVGLSHLQDAIGKVGKVLTGGLSMKDYFSNALGRSQDIVNSAKAIGMSTDALQKWQYAAKASGVSSDSIIGDLHNLNANYFMTEKGVLRLADSFKRMSAQGANWWGNQLGLSQDTILLLRQGSAAIKEFQEEAQKVGAITSEEELKKAAKLNAELEKRKVALQKIVDTIVIKVAPAVEKLLKRFDEWMAADPGRAELVIQGITAALMGLASSQILSGITSLVNFVKSFGIGLVSLSPGAAILGGIAAAIYGLYKDFQKYKNGEESFLPWDSIVKDFEIASDRIAGVIDGIKEKWNAFKEWLKSEEGQQSKKTVAGYASAVIEGEKELIKGSVQAAQDIVNWGGAFIGGALNTQGGIFRPFDMAANALKTGNLALQNAQTLKDAGWDKYFAPNIKTMVPPNNFGMDQQSQQPNTNNTSDEIQNALYSLSNKMPTELTLKSTSVRAFAEVMHELNTSQPHSTSSVVKNADFNGATIQIIATGADLPDVLYSLEEMGADTSDSYNGTGFIY